LADAVTDAMVNLMSVCNWCDNHTLYNHCQVSVGLLCKSLKRSKLTTTLAADQLVALISINKHTTRKMHMWVTQRFVANGDLT